MTSFFKYLTVCCAAVFMFWGCAGQSPAEKSAEGGPRIELSMQRIPAKEKFMVHGSGFTPTGDIQSHLRRPDGSEFPVLPMLTDAGGAFSHEVDTLLLGLGTHELWVEDVASGKTSNTATFEVTAEQPPQK